MERLRRVLMTLSIAAGLAAMTGGELRAQEPPAPRDDGLESLLEKLSEPSDRAGGDSARPADQGKARDRADRKSGKASAGEKAGTSDAKGQKSGAGQSGAKPGKGDGAKAKKGADSLSGEDQEVDDLLKKLGETTETPAREDRPRGGAGGKPDQPQRPSPGGKPEQQPPDRSKLSGKDRENDEHLEQLTGRKRRKKNDNGERTGPAGELIKQMRDIEQKLEKPDTGEGTREEQKKVVKRIDQLIEEVRRSGGSSMMRTVVRRVRRPGQQPGQQQPGGTEGALARGAPLQKPARPTTKHANVGGKDIWGHLPDELRQEIENQSNELPLSAKQELIDRYYLSVGKGKLIREESP